MKKLINTYKDLTRSMRLIVLFVLFLLVSIPTITFSRYIYDLVMNRIYTSQNFYFRSDYLGEEHPEYTISNWGGDTTYPLRITLNSYLNALKYATMDIDYDVEYTCTSKVALTCNLIIDGLSDKNSGTIPATIDESQKKNTSTFQISVTPSRPFTEQDQAVIEIKATSKNPYVKSLSAKFILKTQHVGLTYEITDNKNDVFSTLRLTNSVESYTVDEAFDGYSSGTTISDAQYRMLSDENKEKCSSINVNISFDPTIVQVDMTNKYLIKAIKKNEVTYSNFYVVKNAFGDHSTEDIISEDVYNSFSSSNKSKCLGPYRYVTGMHIKINAISSADINFYKTNSSNDYTYPSSLNDDPIITVTKEN